MKTAYKQHKDLNLDRWLQVLAAKPDDPGSISKTHLVKGENGLPQAVLWPWEVHQGNV